MVGGHVFHHHGISEVKPHMITTALVHDFSNFIEAEIRKRTLDPFHDIKYCALSPAMEKIDGGYLTAFRIYRCPQRHSATARKTASKDLVFVQKFDDDLRPHGQGYILGFAYHRLLGPQYNELWDGPQDPRAFKVNGTVYLLFHAAVYLEQVGKRAIMKPIMWDLDKNLPKIPDLRNNPLQNSSRKYLFDKNWMPLEHNNQLFFVQTLDPSLIISCTLDAVCNYTENMSKAKRPYGLTTALRGGSQFQLWRYPYHIGAVHSFFMDGKKRVYRVHLIILSVPNFRIVFTTHILYVNDSIFKRIPFKRNAAFKSDFFYPVSLLVESKDSLLVAGHINDDRSLLVRIRGIKDLIEEAIERDQEINPQALRPKPGAVQSFFISHFKHINITAAETITPRWVDDAFPMLMLISGLHLLYGCLGPFPWASCQIRKIASCACAGIAGTVSSLPRVSDPNMHHGTCVKQWRGRWKRSGHSRRTRNPQFHVSGKKPMYRL